MKRDASKEKRNTRFNCLDSRGRGLVPRFSSINRTMKGREGKEKGKKREKKRKERKRKETELWKREKRRKETGGGSRLGHDTTRFKDT